ncbi:N-acetylmuramoyl-L-alanine amidase (EC 3.5.1.28), partial [Terribacillus sp. AE2B 122]
VVKNNSDCWLWTYNSANWNDKAIKLKPGEAFTITKELTVSGSKMYQIKSGLYITASTKYVEISK